MRIHEEKMQLPFAAISGAIVMVEPGFRGKPPRMHRLMADCGRFFP